MTGKVIDRPLIRSVSFAAAIVGTIQAVIWFCLSLIAILLYHSVIKIDDNLSEHNYLRILYEIFLDYDYTSDDDVIVTTNVFNIFMYVYVGSSFIWLAVSLYLTWAMKRNKWGRNSVVTSLWSGVTLLISILDIVLISLVVADYIALQDSETTSEIPTETTSTTESDLPEELLLPKSLYDYIKDMTVSEDFNQDGVLRQLRNTTYIIVMTLVARGYILWIINVVLAIILIKFSVDMSKQKTPSLLPMMDGFQTGRPPWTNLYEQTDIGNGYSNGGFTDDNDKTAFPRSDSFVTAEPEGMNRNPLGNGHNPYAQQMEKLRPVSDNPNVVSPKLAKIGKQNGRRTPPRNIPPPNIPLSNSPQIPDPDYTPPGSPSKPKSALRPRSNYVL